MLADQMPNREPELSSSVRPPVLTREDFESRDDFGPGEAFCTVNSAFGMPGAPFTADHVRWMMATLDTLETASPVIFWEWARQRAPRGSIIEVDNAAFRGDRQVQHA